MMTMYPAIKTKLNEGTNLPAYAHDGDAGIDLCATEDVTLRPGEWKMVGSGVSMAIPEGFFGMVVPRSGLGCKGLVFKNTVGVIDSGYRGEIKMPLFNNNPTHWWEWYYGEFFPREHGGHEPKGTIYIRKGDRVAQMLILPVAHATLINVEELDDSERGTGGFGSSGISGGERL